MSLPTASKRTTRISEYSKAAKKSESKNVKLQNAIDEMKQEIQSLKKETKQNPIEKEETINGTYSNIEKIAGQNFKYTVKIYGDIWTSSLEPELFGEPRILAKMAHLPFHMASRLFIHFKVVLLDNEVSRGNCYIK